MYVVASAVTLHVLKPLRILVHLLHYQHAPFFVSCNTLCCDWELIHIVLTNTNTRKNIANFPYLAHLFACLQLEVKVIKCSQDVLPIISSLSLNVHNIFADRRRRASVLSPRSQPIDFIYAAITHTSYTCYVQFLIAMCHYKMRQAIY